MDIAFCPRCGMKREPGMGFCTRCGTNLAEVDAAIAAFARQTIGDQPEAEPTPPPVHPPPPPPVETSEPRTDPIAAAVPARAGHRRARSAVTFRAFALTGGALGVVGALLPWARFHLDRSAFAFPAGFLFTGNAGGRSLSVGLVLVVLAGLGLVLSPFRDASLWRRILGVLVLAVPVAFALQGLQHADAGHVFSVLGPGAYAATIGGLLLAFG